MVVLRLDVSLTVPPHGGSQDVTAEHIIPKTRQSLVTELVATYDAMRSAAGTPRYAGLKAHALQVRKALYAFDH